MSLSCCKQSSNVDYHSNLMQCYVSEVSLRLFEHSRKLTLKPIPLLSLSIVPSLNLPKLHRKHRNNFSCWIPSIPSMRIIRRLTVEAILFSIVSVLTQSFLISMISNTSFVQNFIEVNRLRMQKLYAIFKIYVS